MKKLFQVGDRVACYEGICRWTGDVLEATEHVLLLNSDCDTGDKWFNVKQCRRLVKVKKPRRRIFVLNRTDSYGSWFTDKSQVHDNYHSDLTEFVEVRRRNKK